MPQLLVKGLASKRDIKVFTWENSKDIPKLSLMEFLRSQKIPVASSCFGEGVCRRCKVSETILSCQVKVFELFKAHNDLEITIDYL
jgi:Na+-transporting NADH:ubiquinone oxidoreductase subunit NqrF